MSRKKSDREAEHLAALMQKVAKGDRKAFGRLYARTSAKLYSLVLGITRHESAAEEVLQDVFIRVWHKASMFDRRRARVMTWMSTIARNRAIDWVRGHREEVVTGLDLSVFVDEKRAGPAQDAHRTELARALTLCLAELDPTQRKSILMAFYEGRTHSELSEALAKPLGTVKTWIRRGLARLKECLDRGSHHETA